MEQEHLLIQEIKHLPTGETVDLGFLVEFTLVESMDLSGPKFMVEFHDPESWLRDDVGVKEGDEIEATIADIYTNDGVDEKIKFTILTVSVTGSTVKINAIASVIFAIKKRAANATVYTQKSPDYILGILFPGISRDVGRFPVVEDYHLLAGEYPSYVLRQMSIEQGAHVFLQRDTVCLYRLADIMAQTGIIYHYDNKTEQNQILRHTAPSAQHILEDKIIRRYSGWNMKNGWVSTGESDLCPLNSSSQSTLTMKNIGKSPKPAIDFTCVGNGFLKAGICLDLVWNTLRVNSPIDESLPERVVIFNVAHNYRANKYFCRVKGVTPLEKRTS